jgi:hypothetical protein
MQLRNVQIFVLQSIKRDDIKKGYTLFIDI